MSCACSACIKRQGLCEETNHTHHKINKQQPAECLKQNS